MAGIDHHGVNHRPGHTHRARRQGAHVNCRADLGDDLAARIVGGERDGIGFEVGGLLIKGDVAARIRKRSANQGDVHREGLVAKVLLSFHDCYLDEILLGPRVHLPAAVARIDHRAEAHVREQARSPGADLAIELRNHAAGKDVRLDLLVLRQLLRMRGDQRQ